MRYPTKDKGTLNRREVMARFSAALAAGMFAPSGASAQTRALEQDVATWVKMLAGDKPLTINLLLPNGSEKNVAPVIAQFEQMTGVKVQVTVADVDDINTELLLDGYGDEGLFDVALPATFGLPDLIAAKVILPISEFAKQYEPAGFRSDILYGVGDSFDEKLYGFQTDGDAYTMFYHKGLLQSEAEQKGYADRFGTALMQPTTWEELDQQMAYFNRPEDGKWGGLLFRTPGYLVWEWWVRFHAKGVWPLSKDLDPQIASDQGIAALEDMIRATENMCPEVFQLGLFENWERFSQGDIYCNIGWGGSQKYLNGPTSNMRGNMVYGPTPGGIVDGELLLTPYFNWGWDYVVTTNSSVPEISYLFALFASSPNMSTLSVRQQGGYFDPFRPEHYEDEGIKAAYSREFLDVQRYSLENAIPDLYLQNQGEYFRSLGMWINRALLKEISPKQAMKRAETRWKLITNRADKSVQQQRWMQLRSKYPAGVRERLKDIG